MSLTSSVIQVALMFGTSIFFAAIAIDRETLLSSALAAITWLTCGMINFLFDPTGFGQYVSWIFFLVGIAFVFQLMHKIAVWYDEFKNKRFEVAPL